MATNSRRKAAPVDAVQMASAEIGHKPPQAPEVEEAVIGAMMLDADSIYQAMESLKGGVETIKPHVDDFIAFAKEHPYLFFYVTRIGCGIAGFRDKEIAPLFAEAIDVPNICFPESFVKAIK